MRRLEALPAAVGEEDLQRLLTFGADPERDERVVAHRGRQHEVADAFGAIEGFQSSEIERLGLELRVQALVEQELAIALRKVVDVTRRSKAEG